MPTTDHRPLARLLNISEVAEILGVESGMSAGSCMSVRPRS